MRHQIATEKLNIVLSVSRREYRNDLLKCITLGNVSFVREFLKSKLMKFIFCYNNLLQLLRTGPLACSNSQLISESVNLLDTHRTIRVWTEPVPWVGLELTILAL
jgi:hypothetical protein